MIRIQKFSVTTNGSGVGSDTRPVRGTILRIDTDATAADTSGCDVTWTTSAVVGSYTLAETVLTLTNLGDASAVDYPRRLADDSTGAALGTAGDEARTPFIATGLVTMSVAEGGSEKVYTGAVVYDDGQ